MLHVVSKLEKHAEIMRSHKCHVEYCRLCVSVFLGLMYKHDNLPYMIDLTEGMGMDQNPDTLVNAPT